MYAWQLDPNFTRQLVPGQTVYLNPRWSGYNYLKREFGQLFPAGIQEIHGDIIVVKKQRFARQVLTDALGAK